MRDVTLEGLWWLPSNPEEKIAGILSFTGDTRPTLRLIGAFTHAEQLSTGAYEITVPEKHALIYGLCERHEITLVDCTTSRLSRSSVRQWRHSLQARQLLVGIWLDQPEEACFDRIIVDVDNLLGWSGLTGFRNEDEDLDRIQCRWYQPQSLAAQIGQTSVRVSIGSWQVGTKLWADRTEQSIQESASFAVNVPEMQSADALIREWVKPLQDLLTLATGQACGVHNITLRSRQQGNNATAITQRPTDVQVYLQPVYRSRSDEPAMPPERMLFTLRDMQFSDVLPSWLAVSRQLSPAPEMILGLRYIDRSYAENRLITAVAAAEALHRRLLPENTYVSETEFEQIRSALLDAIPEAHHEWLKQRMWNEPSFKQRLMQLVERLGTELVEPFMPRPNRWANEARDTRNTLVHRFPVSSPPTGAKMYVLAQMTSAVLTLNLLHEIGVRRDHLSRIVRNHESFRWIAEEGPDLMPSLFQRAALEQNDAPRMGRSGRTRAMRVWDRLKRLIR
jgi:ApeA N-terminal domain 1